MEKYRIALAVISVEVVKNTKTRLFEIQKLPLKNELQEKFEGKSLKIATFRTVDGQIIDAHYLKNKVIHINFWSVTCGPCKAEIPDLNKLKSKYQGKEVLFIGIAPDSNKDINKYVKKTPFDYVLIGDKSYFKQLGIESYPVNFFIDRNSSVQIVKTGTPYLKKSNDKWEISVNEDYSAIIDKLLKEF